MLDRRSKPRSYDKKDGRTSRHPVNDSSRSRASPSKQCKPVMKATKIREKYRHGVLERQTEIGYMAEYCSNKEQHHSKNRRQRSSTLPKYLQTSDDYSDNSDNSGRYYLSSGRKYFH